MSPRSLRRRRRALATMTVIVLATAGLIAMVQRTSTGHPGTAASRAPGALVATGPVPARQVIEVTLALRTRHVARLDALINGAERITSGTYDRTFLPGAGPVRRAVRQLRAGGLQVLSPTGSTALVVRGPASAIESTFGVRLEAYVSATGRHAYAPLHPYRLRGAVSRVVSSVVGLDDRQPATAAALHRTTSPDQATTLAQTTEDGLPGGYGPAQVFHFYDFDPLFKAGLDGAGETVVFLEIDRFKQSDLDLYAQQFHLSPFQVSVHQSSTFGQPASTEGEADLDLEVVHAAAPAAKLVVYYANGSDAGLYAAMASMLTTYPQAILSDSIGGCEQGSSAATFSHAADTLFRRFAATGGTVFNAAGDEGAFNCAHFDTVAQWNPAHQSPNVSQPADDPYVTSVGGTSIFPSASGGYGRETAWGNSIEQFGGGGGLSPYFARPSYQAGPGVDNRFSNGKRQVPDVASLGDTNTGWDIAINGQFGLVGGTSSGAPLWAGLAALADQSLAAHGRRSIGFVNPLLYDFAAHPKSVPAPAFHDVTVGNNLYYPATPGWDFATGLGTPDASALVDDLLAKEPKR